MRVCLGELVLLIRPDGRHRWRLTLQRPDRRQTLGTVSAEEVREALYRLAAIECAEDAGHPDRQWLLTTRDPLCQVAAVKQPGGWGIEVCDAEASGLPLIVQLPPGSLNAYLLRLMM